MPIVVGFIGSLSPLKVKLYFSFFKVKCNISKMQELPGIIIYVSRFFPLVLCINKMIIMAVMLHLEYDFIIPKHNYQSENYQQLNSY